jgi:threonine synthase
MGLACSRCNVVYATGELLNVCSCGAPLLVEYDLSAIRKEWGRESLRGSVSSMWRYAPVLPASAAEAVTLGEGWTPLHRASRLASKLGGTNVWIKNEARNPTGSLKARGLSAAVTMAKKLGAKKLAIPSAGDAASALAAYAALAGLEAHIFMPDDVPTANFIECSAFGAHVTLIAGLISDCGRIVAERKQQEGWFDVSTLNEPYRIEGKKTMGYELAEQFDWRLPDAILYPCGGGVGLIGMWKAFSELEALGWIGSERPKMIAVQAAGCAPITRAFEQGAATGEFWTDAHTVAAGLRVPKALGDFLVLRAIRESGGTAVSISDEDLLDASLLLAECEGLFGAPETGACVAALRCLFANSFIKPDEKVVIFSTGSGLKYLDVYATRFPRNAVTQYDKLGGLITPR